MPRRDEPAPIVLQFCLPRAVVRTGETPSGRDTMSSQFSCAEHEPYALQVLGDSMEPEFENGCVIVLDPGYPIHSGAYVIAHYEGEYLFRQYVEEDGRKLLRALNAAYADIELQGPCRFRGVVWQKTWRRARKRYF
jgi:DNA polymerase V